MKGVKPGRVSNMVFISTKPKSRQYTAADGVRSKRYKAVRGDLPDPDVLKVDEAYQDFTADLAPLITTLSISSDVPLVDSAFGTVQEGSPISYQHPVPVSRIIIHHPDAPPPPPLLLDGHRLDPTTCSFVCTHQQHLNVMSLNITFDMARSIEMATREQSGSAGWHSLRKMRLTSSRFREVCHVRGHSSAENLAERICKDGGSDSLDEEGAGTGDRFVIHPDAAWLGSSPDGVVFEPTEAPPFGLVEVKCPNLKSYVDCGYLHTKSGALCLKPRHSYYWQVQGQQRRTFLYK
ncbi:uncharacterized protein LOC116038123 [Sander lucioperca]|uniref:uncharacterized protein LOC116038123 n=1 Tax=Sander lucioperca TaxID=283035 RepID=UPI00125DF443|nr:uncharacterized protein LOC116038123 [Sander lucioperca]